MNDEPTVTATNDRVPVNEGQAATSAGTYGDVDAGDVVALTASVGVVTKNPNAPGRGRTPRTTDPAQAKP